MTAFLASTTKKFDSLDKHQLGFIQKADLTIDLSGIPMEFILIRYLNENRLPEMLKIIRN